MTFNSQFINIGLIFRGNRPLNLKIAFSEEPPNVFEAKVIFRKGKESFHSSKRLAKSGQLQDDLFRTVFSTLERDGLRIVQRPGKSQGQQSTSGLALQRFFRPLGYVPPGKGLHEADNLFSGNLTSEFCRQPRSFLGKDDHPFTLSHGQFIILAMKVKEPNLLSPDIDGASNLFGIPQRRTEVQCSFRKLKFSCQCIANLRAGGAREGCGNRLNFAADRLTVNGIRQFRRNQSFGQ